MATAITPHNPSTLQPSALSTLTFTAATAAGNEITGSRRMLLLVRNDSSASKTFTVTSQPDSKGRTQHITAQSLATNAKAYVYLEDEGWLDSGRKLQLAAEDANIKYALINMGNL